MTKLPLTLVYNIIVGWVQCRANLILESLLVYFYRLLESNSSHFVQLTLSSCVVFLLTRFFYMSHSMYFFFRLRPDDIIYDTLPLYHTAGGILGVGNCLIKGCTIVIRKKFSASRFWEDCVRHKCTVRWKSGSKIPSISSLCKYIVPLKTSAFFHAKLG